MVRQGPHASDELPRLLKTPRTSTKRPCRARSPFLQRDMIRVCAACQQKARATTILDAGTLPSTMRNTAPMRRQSAS